MLDKFTKANPIDLQIWMLSAGIIGLGMGLLLAKYLEPYAEFLLIIGVVAHISSVYKIYSKK